MFLPSAESVIFFKINCLKNSFRNTISVKRFGSGSNLFAKVISKQNWYNVGKELYVIKFQNVLSLRTVQQYFGDMGYTCMSPPIKCLGKKLVMHTLDVIQTFTEKQSRPRSGITDFF